LSASAVRRAKSRRREHGRQQPVARAIILAARAPLLLVGQLLNCCASLLRLHVCARAQSNERVRAALDRLLGEVVLVLLQTHVGGGGGGEADAGALLWPFVEGAVAGEASRDDDAALVKAVLPSMVRAPPNLALLKPPLPLHFIPSHSLEYISAVVWPAHSGHEGNPLINHVRTWRTHAGGISRAVPRARPVAPRPAERGAPPPVLRGARPTRPARPGKGRCGQVARPTPPPRAGRRRPRSTRGLGQHLTKSSLWAELAKTLSNIGKPRTRPRRTPKDDLG